VAQIAKPADAGVAVGEVLQGKYRVDAILGAGGMGVVAECTHLALNERYAIKMLRQDVLMDQDAVQRFIREAQAAVKLKSEYVAHVSDVGTFENGVPYMVMEFLEGHDLGEVLKQRGVLPAPWAAELILQTCEALAEAHSLGIVHRDIKPTNLFVTWRPDGTALIKVLDFGISKSPMGTDMQLTQTQSLLGTPAYMSPEQMRSARLVDWRSDIWSLGTVMYEILEGRRPFEADSFSEMCVKVAVDPAAPMVNTPPALQQVVLRCLAKSPEQRYPNMAELGRELIPFAPDPNQAQMLVERMARMLRRSQGENWEGGTTASGGRVPRDFRDLPSGAVRTVTPPPQWGIGSDPAGQPWHGGSDVSGNAWRTPPRPSPIPGGLRQDGSQPFARPYDVATGSQTEVSKRKRRRLVAAATFGLLVAAGIGLGITMAREDDQPAANGSTAAVQPAQVERTPDPGAGKPSGSAEVKAGSAEVKAAGSAEVKAAGSAEVKAAGSAEVKAAGSAETKAPDGGAKPPVTKKPASNGTKIKPLSSTKSYGGGIKHDELKKANGGKDPNDTKDPTKPSDTVKCDPFASQHGCNKK